MKTLPLSNFFHKSILQLFIVLSAVAFSSCSDDDPNPDEPGVSVPSDADGYLIADRTSENGGSSTLNSARAAFSNTPGVTAAFLNVGTVKCNTVTLTNISNYYQNVGSVNFTAGTLKWEVSGGSGFGAFTRDGLTFPTKPVVSSSENVSRSGGYTVTHNAISGADKIMYTIGSAATPSKLKFKWAASSSSTSMSYSSSDLSGFSIGEDVRIIVTAYKLSTETLGGKRIYIQTSSQDVKDGIIN